VGKCYTYLHAN